MSITEEVVKLYTEGMTPKNIRNKLGLTTKQVENALNKYRRKMRKKGMEVPRLFLRSRNDNGTEMSLSEKVIDYLRKESQGVEARSLLTRLNISPRILDATLADLTDEGYNIFRLGDVVKLSKTIIPSGEKYTEDWRGNKIIRFGAVSDTHLGSKYQQLTHLNTLYDIFEQEDIPLVFHCGDISEGIYKQRPGHEAERFLHTADDIVDYVVENYPKRNGITTKFICGNHDGTIIQNGGHDIGRDIARSRDDMIYLGMLNATVEITPNCTLELNHALDGSQYALSYSIQKYIDSMMGGEKPNVLLNGHHHKEFTTFYRNIHGCEVPCVQAQTKWEKGKRIAVVMGGFIIEMHVDDEGTIQRFRPEFIPFYVPVKDDY